MSRVNQRSYNLSIFGRDQQVLAESRPRSLLTLTTGQEEIVCYHHNDQGPPLTFEMFRFIFRLVSHIYQAFWVPEYGHISFILVQKYSHI